MARINPTTLRRLREKQNWSQDDLSRKASIDKGTIHRIEAGRQARNRQNVIERLSNALKVDPDQLTAVENTNAPEPVTEQFLPKAQLNVRVSAEARNALALVAVRYGVRPNDIIELAPLLFHLVASESLAERAGRLAALRNARSSVEGLHGQFTHLTERLVCDWQGEEIEDLEARSIARLDIRGTSIDDNDPINDPRPQKYDEEEHNPFVTHLRERLAAARPEGSRDTVEGWGAWHGPRYAICHSEALAFFGGDEDAADDLVDGRYPITDMPKDLRASSEPGERVLWAREKRKEIEARAEEYFKSIGMGDLL